MIDLRQGDCLEVMRGMADASVTAIVTDPPYALEFMGKGWDKVLPSDEVWREALRVLKPGGILLSFGGTRTFHRLTCSIEDAGFEIRDCLSWMYGSGFPKSMAIDKAIDKADGAERPVVGKSTRHGGGTLSGHGWNIPAEVPDVTGPATDRSAPWAGYGTALKPAWEPIVFAMKPTDGTFAANALLHGVAGINVDGCRVGDDEITTHRTKLLNMGGANSRPWMKNHQPSSDKHVGRWPANVVHDGGDAATAMGAAARFFYCAKASKKDRGEGNTHPTVKPTELMRWLVRMVKMPGGTVVLDPFMGSGSTGVACAAEGVDFVGIEREAEYLDIARRRINT
jgi:DNA modification methylase